MSGASLIPLERLTPNPSNPREELEGIEELAATMREVGVLVPLLVRPDPRHGLLIVDGHRRYAAAQIAPLPAVPCLALRASSRRPDDVALMLIADLHHRLKPIEEARGFEALRHRGLTVAAIARLTGRSPSTVSDRLLLATLPLEAQDLVEENHLGVTEATQLARDVRAHRSGSAAMRTSRSTWLVASHPLAGDVRAACGHKDARVLVGGVGCGQCWEDAIRHDEAARATALPREVIAC